MDARAQQEQDELQSYLWHCLSALKPFISAETFEKAEREIGMSEETQ